MNHLLKSLIYSIATLILLAQTANASLIANPEGFSVALTRIDGTPEFVNYTPVPPPANGLPFPLTDETEMEVFFFDNYFEISQFVTVDRTIPTALDWQLLLKDIVFPEQIIGVTIDEMTNTFVNTLNADFTDDGITITFEGGSAESLIPNRGNRWFARVDVEFGVIEVSAPTSIFLLLLIALYGLNRSVIRN